MKRLGFVAVAGLATAASMALLVSTVAPVGATPHARPVPAVGSADSAAGSVAADGSGPVSPLASAVAGPKRSRVAGYFTEWGVYDRNYHVKNIETSGSASKLTDILYAFGATTGGVCSIGDPYAAYQKPYSAADSVNGVADADQAAVKGNFGQLRRLKKRHPGLKVIWSFGGFNGSGGFTQAAAHPAAFADSCYRLVEDRRWADVFDGIDIDWEYPNTCGLTCDTTGRSGYPTLIKALRARFGRSALVTSAITADGSVGGKIEAADYAGAGPYLNWLMPMTYDYYGTWAATGPTAPHSPLRDFAGAPNRGLDTATTIATLRSLGVPARKLLLGLGFYGRGWTGVDQSAPGGAASGPAPGTAEAGVEDYRLLATRCPVTGTVGGTGYARCGAEWWSYDTPGTISTKMRYAKRQHLGGSFVWELGGDTADGDLITAVRRGLR